MSGHSRGKNNRAKVWVRIRPTAKFARDMIDLQPDGKTINIHCSRDPKKGLVNNQIVDWSFRVDGIMHHKTQEDVYQTVVPDMITSALDGYSGTILCYGQTGAGKTYTMTGATENYRQRGIVPRALSQLFKEIEDRPEYAVNVRISFLEIYNEMMFDLLSTLPETMKSPQISNMAIVDDEQGVMVKGLACLVAQNEEDALNMLFEGETNRAIAAHTLNKQSSRSHCIFTVYLETRSRTESNAKYTISKLNFVDLAGSERLGKTQSQGKTKEEAMFINKSLSFLEQVVVALADQRRDHVPFRQSKLTHFLKDSIGGFCYTRLIANIWGEAAQIEETISTLRFGMRMMCVAAEPTVKVHYDPAAMVKNLEHEIQLLKRELAMHDMLANRSQITYDVLSDQQRYDIRRQVRLYLEGRTNEIDVKNLRQIQGIFEAFRDLSREMVRNVETDLQSRYTMIDKTSTAAIAAAQSAGLPVGDDGELVSEMESSGYLAGTTSSSTKPTSSYISASRKKEIKKGKSKERSSPGVKTAAQHAAKPSASEPVNQPAMQPDKEDKRDSMATPSSTPAAKERQTPVRPSTPPLRTEAFEEFKKELGSEINRILLENKEILAAKKKRYVDLAKEINCDKEQIDRSRLKLEELQAQRDDDGPAYNEDGDIIISEDEYLEIRRLKDLKAVYRKNADELKMVKSEVQYCQRLVDQCRQKLIHEFDNWYAESFLNTAPGEAPSSAEAGYGNRLGVQNENSETLSMEDEQEKFDRLQMELLMKDPDSASFHNAKLKLQRRKMYELVNQQYSPSPAIRKAPAMPTRTIRSQPPSSLQVQY